MDTVDHPTRARLELAIAGDVVPLGVVDATGPCDLGVVDRILRLRLAAARLGAALRLTDVDDELRALIELVGVTDVLGLADAEDGRATASGRPPD